MIFVVTIEVISCEIKNIRSIIAVYSWKSKGRKKGKTSISLVVNVSMTALNGKWSAGLSNKMNAVTKQNHSFTITHFGLADSFGNNL